jgi:2-haloacid dehalogenase
MKVLIFDAYGTLFNVKMPIKALENILGMESSSFLDVWRQKTLNYTWLRTLMDAWLPFDKVVEDALNYTLEHFRVEDEALRMELLHVYLDPVCFPEVETFLQTHQSLGHKMAILSNGSPQMLNMGVVQNNIDGYFSGLFSSNEVRKFKPSPKIYQLVHEHLAIGTDDVIFFSSNAWDVAGASNFGWKSIWVNRNRQPFDHLGLKPWRAIYDLLEF